MVTLYHFWLKCHHLLYKQFCLVYDECGSNFKRELMGKGINCCGPIFEDNFEQVCFAFSLNTCGCFLIQNHTHLSQTYFFFVKYNYWKEFHQPLWSKNINILCKLKIQKHLLFLSKLFQNKICCKFNTNFVQSMELPHDLLFFTHVCKSDIFYTLKHAFLNTNPLI